MAIRASHFSLTLNELSKSLTSKNEVKAPQSVADRVGDRPPGELSIIGQALFDAHQNLGAIVIDEHTSAELHRPPVPQPGARNPELAQAPAAENFSDLAGHEGSQTARSPEQAYAMAAMFEEKIRGDEEAHFLGGWVGHNAPYGPAQPSSRASEFDSKKSSQRSFTVG